jgi:hypothetical protein
MSLNRKLNDPRHHYAIALFIDAYTNEGIQNQGNLNLALALARNTSFEVTIFSNDPTVPAQISGVENLFLENVPGSLFETDSRPETMSLAVYHLLSARNFDAIYFDANSNAAFHVLVGQSIGAKCLGAHIVVGVTQPVALGKDEVAPSAKEITELYLRQRTIELNVSTFYSFTLMYSRR